MEGVEMIQKIREQLVKNEGKWDLTNDNGEAIVYDSEKDVNIPDLILKDDKEICAVIPLGYFCDETIERIYNIVKYIPKNMMNGQELSTHQRGVILRGICNGVALKKKNPKISENNTAITFDGTLDTWDICCISSDAEAFGMKAEYHYEGRSRIVFTPTSNMGKQEKQLL